MQHCGVTVARNQSGIHQPAASYQLCKLPPGQKPWQCRPACFAPTLWRRVRIPPSRSRGLSSSILSKSPGIFQTWTRWTLKPVGDNGPVSFLSTSSVPPPTVGHPLLHPNGILSPTPRLSLLLFRSVGPSIYPLKVPPQQINHFFPPRHPVGSKTSHSSLVLEFTSIAGIQRNFFFHDPISPPSSSFTRFNF